MTRNWIIGTVSQLDSNSRLSLIFIRLTFDGDLSAEGRQSFEAEAGHRDEDKRDVDADQDEVDVAEHARLLG